MVVRIVEREHFRIIGLKLETLLNETREQMLIPKLQQSFNEKLEEVNGAIDLPTTYGLFIDPPNYKPDTDHFTWIAGVKVSPDAEPPKGMISYELPRTTYAVLEYRGDIDRAGNAYGELYKWISNSEYELAGTYGFELYSMVHSPLERGNADFLLHFPIKNKDT
ncbi:GyrI-like domain-containing protein [Paenibacillus allorhizosphaerae]|uniref:AraC effector-binding domain-containing protein n=1 Tax=Paenibacillus allorhizosphaerae TaxID=2849866 RepID=A0ABM8VTP4_9BACL|nr:GyrI-like domain-containing protein [Paenibacillus allorhizosphaerae]CAG7657654.1 hypothetical protein PAECIP111802_06806 [Paenibacillus allorhizosphaerae]